MGGRDDVNKTHGPRRAQLGSNKPRSDQWVSIRKQGGGKEGPEREEETKPAERPPGAEKSSQWEGW